MSSEDNPFDYFDAIYCINLDHRNDRWNSVQNEFKKIGIDERVIRFSAIKTPENGHIGCMLSHRKIVEIAKNKWYKNVLVFEDDIFFRKNKKYFSRLISDLKKIEKWDLFYFWWTLSKKAKLGKRTKNISTVSWLYYAHAVAYWNNFYNFFLKEIQKKGIRRDNFIRKWGYFDSWLAEIQKKCTAIMDINFSVFQKRKDSDTDGNNSWKSYLHQYVYIIYKYRLLKKILLPILFKI